jgi:hypothetical protein
MSEPILIIALIVLGPVLYFWLVAEKRKGE